MCIAVDFDCREHSKWNAEDVIHIVREVVGLSAATNLLLYVIHTKKCAASL